MNNLEKPEQFTKSPLIFLSLMGILVISTLVVASEYFLRPQIEAELKKEPTQRFAVINTPETPKIKTSSKLIEK
jgi:hypothetical protein